MADSALRTDREDLALIRFRGHYLKGGCDVHNRGNEKPTPRRRFTDEFKQQAVRLVLDGGKRVTRWRASSTLVVSTVGQWVKHAQADRANGSTGLTSAERESWCRSAERFGSRKKSETS